MIGSDGCGDSVELKTNHAGVDIYRIDNNRRDDPKHTGGTMPEHLFKPRHPVGPSRCNQAGKMMKRTTVLIGLTLLMLSGPVFGQVAAPRMNSLQIESPFPYNPAVLPWSPNTRITLGSATTSATQSVAGITSDLASGSGSLVQFRLLGNTISIMAEVLNLGLSIEPALGGGDVSIDNTLVALSYQIGGWLSFGIGSRTNQFSDPISADKSAATTFGTGVRLWDNFYFGYSVGNISESNSLGESSRPVSTYGLAIQWREGPEGMHLEGYVENRGDTSAPLFIESEVVTGAIVEAILFNLLFSFESISNKISDAAGSTVRTVDDSIASFGWLPEDGFTIGVTIHRTKETDIATGNATFIDTTFLNLGWMF